MVVELNPELEVRLAILNGGLDKTIYM